MGVVYPVLQQLHSRQSAIKGDCRVKDTHHICCSCAGSQTRRSCCPGNLICQPAWGLVLHTDDEWACSDVQMACQHVNALSLPSKCDLVLCSILFCRHGGRGEQLALTEYIACYLLRLPSRPLLRKRLGSGARTPAVELGVTGGALHPPPHSWAPETCSSTMTETTGCWQSAESPRGLQAGTHRPWGGCTPGAARAASGRGGGPGVAAGVAAGVGPGHGSGHGVAARPCPAPAQHLQAQLWNQLQKKRCGHHGSRLLKHRGSQTAWPAYERSSAKDGGRRLRQCGMQCYDVSCMLGTQHAGRRLRGVYLEERADRLRGSPASSCRLLRRLLDLHHHLACHLSYNFRLPTLLGCRLGAGQKHA